MAVKSIIDIDVQDEAFKRFLDLFDEFQSKIADLPDEWKKVDAAMSGAGKTFAKTSGASDAILAGMAASSATIVEAIHKATKAQREFEHATRKSHTALDGVAKTASKVSHSIFGIGKWMLKWGTLGGGLAGIAGGVGLDDLAYSALSRQRSARGIGMTPGQQAAFQTYFGQFGATQGVESGIANARNDVSKRWIFSGLGITPQDLATKSNFALAIEAERRAQQIVKAAPRGEWENIAQARGLTQAGFTMEQLRVLRHTSAASLNRAAAGAAGSVNALGFTPGVAREWTQFSIALRRAGVEIESSLITGLHGLTKELSAVSADLSKWIAAFVKGPEMGKIITDAENGLKVFANFLGSPQFGKDLNKFENAIALAASEMVSIAKGLAPYVKTGNSIWNANPMGLNKVTPDDLLHGAGDYYRDLRRFVGMGNNNPGNIRHKNEFGAWVTNRYPTEGAGMKAMAQLLQSYPTKHHADTIASIIPIWNGHGANDDEYIKNVSRWSGYSPQEHLNLSNPTVRDHLMAAMIREEHSEKITPQQVQGYLGGAHGLPQSVDRLVKTLRKQQAQKPATVVIRNQTSARVALQANGAAY
ncbi:hypothetical protein FE249_15955 [Acidiphilium multivorum]|uniref:hypothetical protein n=1 Tax=Acidiphilium multivorum TaxID=62140 RepID=UPI001F4C1210|nr:hypothetical protein [Acidiphilium multivorum]UNC15606.1 hypothetical protein FE249_15955 [Acidiphilium multivorum]